MSSLRGTALALSLLTAPAAWSGAGINAASIDVPLLVDAREIDQLPAFLSGDGSLLAVDGKRLAAALRPYLPPAELTRLLSRTDAGGKITPGALKACGIDFSFDPARLETRVRIPAAQRPSIPLDLAQRQDKIKENIYPPAALSGYLNILAGLEYSGTGTPGGQERRQPPVVDLDGALRGFGTVLEGVVTYRGQQDVPWQRQDFRLVRDFRESRVRASFGDVNYGISGFQSSQRMGGLAVERSLDLQRGRSSAPAADRTLILERNSRVEVWINGQRSQTLQLAPGRYDVRNFPMALGTNDVTLRITDEVGREETVRFPFVFDSSLLGRGEQDFSYAAGFLSQVTPEGRSYDTGEPAFSAYHGVGVTDQLTLGGSAQGSRFQQMCGAVGRWATDLGTLRADVALSRAAFAPAGSAARLQYRYQNTVAGADTPSWTAAATYRSPSFTALGDLAPANPYALDLALAYGRRSLWDVLATIGLGRQFGRAGQPDGSSADLTLYRSFRHGLLASLLLSRRSTAANQPENRAYMSVALNFGSLDTVTASQDSAGRATRLDWRHSASRRVRSADYDLRLEHGDAGDSGQGELHYRDYRFSADASGSFDKIPQASRTNSRLTLNLGTALAFAGGRAALSRPITDSFAIVVPHPSLAGKAIEVNAGDEIPEAKTGPLGPAVLPELLSYEEHAVYLSAPELPPWVDLGRQPQYVFPAYRSGTLLTAGTGAVVILEGLFADAAGLPLPSEPGDLEQLDEPAAPAVGFFTAKNGRFAVEGLKPGKVRLILRNYPASPFLLTIPTGRAGIVDAGTLKLPRAK